MQVVVIMVVMTFFLPLLPWHVLVISYEFRLFTPGYTAFTVSSLLLQLNNCINPVFYAFLSPRVREGVCFCFVGKKGNKRKTPKATNIFTSTVPQLTVPVVPLYLLDTAREVKFLLFNQFSWFNYEEFVSDFRLNHNQFSIAIRRHIRMIKSHEIRWIPTRVTSSLIVRYTLCIQIHDNCMQLFLLENHRIIVYTLYC